MKLLLTKSRLLSALLLIAVLAIWELATRQFGLSSLVLPAPSAVAESLWSGLRSGYFWPHLWASLKALLLGLLIGSAVGLVSGMALAEFPLMERVLKPYVVVSQVVPKLALAPLFVLWFGFGLLPVVLITALICFFRCWKTRSWACDRLTRSACSCFRCWARAVCRPCCG